MAVLTKEDLKQIKGVVVEVVEPLAQAMQKDFEKVNVRLDSVEIRLDGIEREFGEFRKNASELFIKLDRFISLYEDQRIELSSLSAQVSRLEDEVEKLKARIKS